MASREGLVPYGAGPLLPHCVSTLPLLPAGQGSIFAGGLLGPEGVCRSRGAYRVQRGKVPASALAYVPVTFPGS